VAVANSEKEVSMACEDIEARLKDLRAQKRSLESVLPGMKGPALQAMQGQLARLESQIAVEEVNLDNCRKLHQTNPPVPFVGHVKDIHCQKAKKEVGPNEPYLLITTVDMNAPLPIGGLPVTVPAVRVFKVGPWSDVKTGSRRQATDLKPIDNPRFWGLAGQVQNLQTPQDVMFLVAMMENDSSSPEAIRLTVEPVMLASVVAHRNLPYTDLAAQLRQDMAGTIDTVNIEGLDPGHLNVDDRIGGVAHLQLTTTDLNTIYALGHQEKSLTFTYRNQSNNITEQYTVTFSFEA
jgi:hypothetical protein